MTLSTRSIPRNGHALLRSSHTTFPFMGTIPFSKFPQRSRTISIVTKLGQTFIRITRLATLLTFTKSQPFELQFYISLINQIALLLQCLTLSYEPFHFDVERLLNDSPTQEGNAGRNGAPCSVRFFKPRMDIHEDTQKNFVTATFEFPGVSKDDVRLNFQNAKLTVSAETKKPEVHADTGYTLRERLHGKFSRSFQLAQGVQDEQIKAAMENGLLTVTFPKTLPELAPKKIGISDL